MRKRCLITLHGVNSDRKAPWQQSFRVFDSWFDIHSIRMKELDGVAGAIRVCIDPTLATLATASLLGSIAASVAQFRSLAWVMAVASLGLLVGAAVVSFLLRRKLLSRLKKQYEEIRTHSGGQSPDVIAHSFGTFLFCKLLGFPDV